MGGYIAAGEKTGHQSGSNERSVGVKRGAVAIVVLVLVGVIGFIILVPVVSMTEYPPCPPPSPSVTPYNCGPFTYYESISFYYSGVGALYGFCGSHDGYHLANVHAGLVCSNGLLAAS